MVGHLRVKSPWSQLGIFLGLFGGAFLITSLVMAVVMLLLGMSPQELNWTDPELVPTMKLVQAISSVFLFLLPAVIFALIVYRGNSFNFLGLNKPRNNLFYLLATVCILAAFPMVMWLGEINHRIPLPQWMNNLEKDALKQMQAFLKADNTLDIMVNVFIIAFIPAICEEICFRGALQRIVIQMTRNAWTGIILTAVFFSALHLQFQGFLPRMFLGIILGAIYWYSGSLWPSIVAHFVNNAVQVVAVSYAPEYIDKNPSIPVVAALASGLFVIFLMWKFRSISSVSYEQVYESDELNRKNQFIA